MSSCRKRPADASARTKRSQKRRSACGKSNFSSVVGNLFTRFDISFRKDKDPFLSYIYFAIRGARMIDESRRICTDIAINREFFIDFEKIFAGVCLYLGSCGRLSLVFNNAGAPLNWFFCEEPAAA